MLPAVKLKLLSNPPNPYLSEHREYLEEPPPQVRLEVFEERGKSILSENDSPDIPFRWSINPYRGCQHACAYCYARPTHEYVGWGAGTDFETRIVVKTNAAELLRAAFARPSWRNERVCFSGVTDCYQPLEAAYRLTRACLEVCRDFANPVSIVTRSFLIRRDVDVLRELHERGGVEIFISIPFADDRTARLIEPQAAVPSRRLEAVRILSQFGLPVSVMVAPIIPGLNDTEIPTILLRAAQAGAKSAGYTALRLPGSVAPVFLERLRAAMPLRADRVEARIREMRGGGLNNSAFGARMRGEGKYWQSIRSLFKVSLHRYGLRDIGCGDDREAGGGIVGRKPKKPATKPEAQLSFQFEEDLRRQASQLIRTHHASGGRGTPPRRGHVPG